MCPAKYEPGQRTVELILRFRTEENKRPFGKDKLNNTKNNNRKIYLKKKCLQIKQLY